MTVKRNIIANLGGQGWAALLGLAVIPVYVRYLGVEAYGLIGIFALLQACLSIIDSGLSPTLTRELARFTAGTHSIESIRALFLSLEFACLVTLILIGLLISIAAGHSANEWLIATTVPKQELETALQLMAWGVVARMFESFYRGALYGMQHQVWFNVTNTILITLKHGGAVVVLSKMSATITAFFGWHLFASVVAVVVMAAKSHAMLPQSPVPTRLSITPVIGIWPFAQGMMLTTTANILLTQGDRVLLARLLRLEEFGYYTLAATVANVAYMITSPVVQAIYPRLVEHAARDDTAELASVYHYGAQIVVLLAAPSMLTLSVFSREVLFVWSGDPDLASRTSPILSALALATFLNVLLSMPYQLQLAYGWTAFALKCTLIALIFVVPAIAFVVPRYGAIGAAWISVGLYGCYILGAVHFMHKRLLISQKNAWYWNDVILPTCASLAVVAVFRLAAPVDYPNRLGWLAFLVVSGATAMAATAIATDRIRHRLVRALGGAMRQL